MKKVIIIGGVLLVFVVVGLVLMFDKLDKDAEHILEEDITEISLVGIADGTYTGEYMEALATNAKVEVYVENEEIVNLVILAHSNGQGEDAESILEDVLREQSVMVDDVAGATYSSRVIKLAIIDALRGDDHE